MEEKYRLDKTESVHALLVARDFWAVDETTPT